MFDHLTGILGGGIHRGTAGTLLTGNTLAQGTVDDTGQIFRDDGVKHSSAVRLIEHQAFTLLPRLGARCIERQDRQDGSRLGQHGDKLGERDADLIKLPCQEFLADKARDLEAIADRDVPRHRKRGG